MRPASLIFMLLPPIASGAEFDLYFLGGQSNMDGYGYVEELPSHLKNGVEGAWIFTGNAVGDDEDGGGLGRWAKLQPGFGTGFSSTGEENRPSNRFGPELSFAARLAEIDPARRIAIVKYARGGSSLARDISGDFGDWDPDYPTANQYDFAMTAIRLARGSEDIDGDGEADTLTPRGIVWMQGESDAYDNLEAALAYESNLVRLIELLRDALNDPALPVVVGKITDSGRDDDGRIMTHIATVQSAQERFVEKDVCAALVKVTDDFIYPPDDDWHYTSDGYVALGDAFADAAIGLETSCGERSP